MKQFHPLLLILLFTVSCAGVPCVPEVRPVDRALISSVKEGCDRPFPRRGWQFVHSIEASLPGRGHGSFMGITEVSPGSGALHCVLLSIEGLVLFDGFYRDGEISVRRSVRPFDSRDFARGLMDDIRMVFLRPGGRLVDTGVLDNGFSVCRYRSDAGIVVDVITMPGGEWEIRRYENLGLVRTVRAYFDDRAFPGRMEISVNKGPGYILTLKLIRAEPLNQRSPERLP